ncbi:MAG: MFS transporter [Phycisphaerae bacterium]|nr:MFS transporter [Phycisphaerae bacterium]
MSPLAPLRRAAFRSLWVAALASNIGTWMHDVGAGWAMTSLGTSAFMVALVQAAATTPMFLLSLPAGAFADVVDRRKLMLAVQAGMLIIAAILAWAAGGGWLTATGLLAATAGLGIGAAMVNPAWQTAMTDLVPAEELPSAAALNSISLNLSRAVGPALGGLLVARLGPSAVFALNAVSFMGIIAALWAWRYQRPPQAAPAERFLGAMQAGVRYVRHSPSMRSQLVRTASFTLFASALWALMPLIARRHLDMGPTGYGMLLASLGAGAVAGTFIHARARARMTPNAIVVAATGLSAAATTTVGLVGVPWIACLAIAGAGVAWVSMVVSLNVAALAGTPGWVRARALACYFTVFFGGMAIGSATWGSCADHVGIPSTLFISSAGLLATLATIRRHPLRTPTPEELRFSNHWEDPAVAREIRADDGPVVVTIEYFIQEADTRNFIDAMGPVSQTRYRDGAFSWTLSRCTHNPRRWLEVFMVESWAEHLRQHARATIADRKIQVRAKRFHVGPDKPRVSHFVAVDVPRGAAVADVP